MSYPGSFGNKNFSIVIVLLKKKKKKVKIHLTLFKHKTIIQTIVANTVVSLVLSATMGKRSNTFFLYLTLLLYHLTNTVSRDSPPYTPVDNIILNSGSSGNSTTLDGWTWFGDINS